MTKNYGLIIEPLQPEDFVLGSDASLENKYGAAVINPDADWSKYAPKDEDQSTKNGDTFACTVFGTLDCIEMLAKLQWGVDLNLSDRFVAKFGGVIPGVGANPKKIADWVRHNWSVFEEEWPDVDSVEEYYAEPPGELRTLAKARGNEYEFGYQYISAIPTVIREALKRYTVAVAVTAWQEKDGVYVRVPGIQENHWAKVLKVYDNGDYKIGDSFPPFTKRVKPEAVQSIAMSYYLSKRVRKDNIFVQILNAIIAYLSKSATAPAPTPPPVAEEPKPVEPSIRERVHEAALANLGKDLSSVAPDERACAESVSRILKEALGDFPIQISTIKLHDYLKADKRFKGTLDAKPGVIIVSPTQGKVVGHTGIFTEGQRIISNTSATGKWSNNYSLDSWVKYFRRKKGLKLYFFEPRA